MKKYLTMRYAFDKKYNGYISFAIGYFFAFLFTLINILMRNRKSIFGWFFFQGLLLLKFL